MLFMDCFALKKIYEMLSVFETWIILEHLHLTHFSLVLQFMQKPDFWYALQI